MVVLKARYEQWKNVQRAPFLLAMKKDHADNAEQRAEYEGTCRESFFFFFLVVSFFFFFFNSKKTHFFFFDFDISSEKRLALEKEEENEEQLKQGRPCCTSCHRLVPITEEEVAKDGKMACGGATVVVKPCANPACQGGKDFKNSVPTWRDNGCA